MRIKILITLFVVLLAASAARAQDALQATLAQVDAADYPTVTLYVEVVDAAGEIVGGLPRESFQLTEDKAAVHITDFSAGNAETVNVVLLIDQSRSMEFENKMDAAENAAIAFIDEMRAQDKIALITFDEHVNHLRGFTADKTTLKEAIRGITTGECTAIYDSIYAAVDSMEGISGRRVIILLTDGIDCREVPSMSDRGSNHTLGEAISYAQDAELAVYVIGLGNKADASDLWRGIDEAALRRIATETVGDYYYAPTGNKLRELYESLAGRVQREYVITYVSPRPGYDGTRRDINIIVQQGDTIAEVDSTYLEKHLINLRSNGLIGLVYAAPLLLALVAPPLLKRAKPRRPFAPRDAEYTPPMGNAYAPQPMCSQCGQPLRPNAAFCGHCGQPTAPRTAACPQCGAALVRPDSKFCGTCGGKIR